MKQFAPLLVIAILLIGVGTYYQGKYAERWRPMDSEQLQRFTSCVGTVPLQIGRWEGTDDEAITDKEWEATNCTAYVSRTYRHADTGKTVSFYLVSGTARHITIHTPDWCYVGAGFKKDGEIEKYTLKTGGTDAEFATAVFRKPDTSLRIFWTYSDDGTWLGPTNANWAKAQFGGRPAMYKVYLIAEATDDPQESSCNDFARDVFPILDQLLFAEAATSDPATDKAVPGASDLEF